MKNTQTQPTIELTVLRDQEPDYEYMERPATAVETALSTVGNTLGQLAAKASLEASMLLYDTIHRTNYRVIRHELVRQKCNAEFERSIGLIAVNKK
jgi:hypothetical protein